MLVFFPGQVLVWGRAAVLWEGCEKTAILGLADASGWASNPPCMSERPSKASSCKTCGLPLADGVCPNCAKPDGIAGIGLPPELVRRAEPAQPPRLVGDFELIEEVARGGMGVVWKARHRRLNRIVALKLIRTDCLSEAAAATRFRREAEAAARLKHPNIVRIHEIGEVGEQLFIAMDLAEGGSLVDLMRRTVILPRDAASLIAKVARGVHHAHENGIVHRDIKPGNILLDPHGEPMVCDFGLARVMTEVSDLTLSLELLGTPAYISPEQAEGPARNLGPASDTYSLGAVLYELLCGHPPFQAENLHTLVKKVVEESATRPPAIVAGSRIPYDLSTICLKCLEKEPKSRYPTALALAEDLERWARGEVIVARPVAPAERVWKWVRRKPVLAGLWFAITLLTFAAAAMAMISSARVTRQREIAEDQAKRSREMLARQLSLSAQYLIEQGDWLRGLPALAEAIRIGTGDPLHDRVNRIRFGVVERSAPRLAHAWLSGDPVFRAAGNRSGTRLMLATRRKIEVWDIERGTMVGKPLEVETEIGSATFDSKGGRWAVVRTESGLCRVWHPDDGSVRDVGHGDVYSPPDAYLQDGNLFVLFNGNSWEVQAAMREERMAGPFQHKDKIEWAVALVSQRRVMGLDAKGLIHLWDMSTGKDVIPPIALGEGSRGADLDGYNSHTQIASLHRGRECWLLNCVSGEVTSHHVRLPDIPQSFGWDQSGAWIYLARNDDGAAVRQVEGDALRWQASHGALGFRGSFAPDSRMVATQSWIGSARVWDMESGEAVTPYLWQTATPGSCILTPSGRWLLTRGEEPAARLWSLPPDEGATAMPDRVNDAKDLFFAGDPERLICADTDGRVVAWDLVPPQSKVMEFQHPEEIFLAEPANGGKLVFTAGSRTAALWDLKSGRPFGRQFVSSVPILDADADQSGVEFAVVVNGGDIVVWDPVAGVERRRIPAKAHKVLLSPDGRLLIALSGASARTWDRRTGEAVSKPVDESGGLALAVFSPDGKRVVQMNTTAPKGPSYPRVWDAATGEVLLTLPPHWLGVRTAAWSPDGTRVATGGGDLTVQICDARTGERLAPPMNHSQKVRQLGFSSDGLLLWARVDREVIVRDAISGERVIPRVRALRGARAVALASDGQRMATIGRKAAPMLWDLSPDLRSPEALRMIASVLSGHSLVNGTGALAPLRAVELRDAWERGRTLVGGWERTVPPEEGHPPDRAIPPAK